MNELKYVFWLFSLIFGLHRMHEMLTIVTDVRGVRQSVCLSPSLNRQRLMQSRLRAMCGGSFSAAFAKCLWPLVSVLVKMVKVYESVCLSGLVCFRNFFVSYNSLLGCFECVTCRLLLPMFAVSVCQSVHQSVCLSCGTCSVLGVIWCSLCQIILASCLCQHAFGYIYSQRYILNRNHFLHSCQREYIPTQAELN